MRVNNYLSKRCSDVQLKLNGRDFHHRLFENENKLFLVQIVWIKWKRLQAVFSLFNIKSPRQKHSKKVWWVQPYNVESWNILCSLYSTMHLHLSLEIGNVFVIAASQDTLNHMKKGTTLTRFKNKIKILK